jgi:hypothetical protein
MTRTCVYCGIDKPTADFSLEHIFPQAFGGLALDDFWQTQDVCKKCNSNCGVFVDGAFIKSWFGSGERVTAAFEYLQPTYPKNFSIPLQFMTLLSGTDNNSDEVVELWLGPSGEQIHHFRPANKENTWDSYAGGDPKNSKKKSQQGRAYLALTASHEYWLKLAINSFEAHFKGDKFITTEGVPESWTKAKKPDPTNSTQAADLRVIGQSTRKSGKIRVQTLSERRFRAKLALGAGYKVFGREFLLTDDAIILRSVLRESSYAKSKKFPLRGRSYLETENSKNCLLLIENFGIRGAWSLILTVTKGVLSLNIITPSSKFMSVFITDKQNLIDKLTDDERDGRVWLLAPGLKEAIGPLWVPDLLAHKLGCIENPALVQLDQKRCPPDMLPPKHHADGKTVSD